MSSQIFEQLAPHEVAAALSCLAAGEMRQGSDCLLEPSEPVLLAAAQIEPIAFALSDAQAAAGVDYAVNWSAQYAGLVQAWAAGLEWTEVMAATSLDAGDVLRLLSRTMELLRQTLNAPFVAQSLRESVREALHNFDRAPLSSDMLAEARQTEGSVLGSGPMEAGVAADLDEEEDDEDDEGEEWYSDGEEEDGDDDDEATGIRAEGSYTLTESDTAAAAD